MDECLGERVASLLVVGDRDLVDALDLGVGAGALVAFDHCEANTVGGLFDEGDLREAHPVALDVCRLELVLERGELAGGDVVLEDLGRSAGGLVALDCDVEVLALGIGGDAFDAPLADLVCDLGGKSDLFLDLASSVDADHEVRVLLAVALDAEPEALAAGHRVETLDVVHGGLAVLGDGQRSGDHGRSLGGVNRVDVVRGESVVGSGVELAGLIGCGECAEREPADGLAVDVSRSDLRVERLAGGQLVERNGRAHGRAGLVLFGRDGEQVATGDREDALGTIRGREHLEVLGSSRIRDVVDVHVVGALRSDEGVADTVEGLHCEALRLCALLGRAAFVPVTVADALVFEGVACIPDDCA